ncbi:MAG: hypothetical protein R3Y36_03485 [Spirochaetales bacterium]
MESYRKNVLRIEEEGMFVHSNLSVQDFARAKMGQYINEKGYVLSENTNSDDYAISEFCFSGTQTIPTGRVETVVITAPAFAGKPLLDFFENPQDKRHCIDAVNAVCKAVEWALQNPDVVTLNNCGPLGTLVGDDGSVLFLPFELFERSMFAQEDSVSAKFYGCWKNDALNAEDSWRFTLSAYVYTALAGTMPFDRLNDEQRAEDYYDNNFVPLDCYMSDFYDNARATALAKAVNFNLSLTHTAHRSIKPTKKKSPAFKTHASKDIYSMPLPLPIDYAITNDENPVLSDKGKQFIAKKTQQLIRKRFLRKHGTKIGVGFAVFAFVVFIVVGIVRGNLQKPTTDGMTSAEVVQSFYGAVNTLNNELLDACGESRAIKQYSTMVTTLFVTGKMREAYEQAVGFLTPGQWVCSYNPLEFSVFGLTHVDIHGYDNQYPPEKGDAVQYAVTFYMIMSAGDTYEITSHIDTVTLTYEKNWQITSVDSTQTPVDFDADAFRIAVESIVVARDIFSSTTAYEQGEELIASLGDSYEWLPSAQDVLLEAEAMSAYLVFHPAVFETE